MRTPSTDHSTQSCIFRLLIMAPKYTAILFTILIGITEIHGHGRTMDPVNRGSAWRKKFHTPPDYDDTEHNCGGFTVQHYKNGGKCGVCGDNYAAKQPRPHENGGYYGTGTIVKTYQHGETIEVLVDLTTSHGGHFEFSICRLNSKNDVETEECFEQYPLQLASGGTKYPIRGFATGEHRIKLILPQGLHCEHCTFRWHYHTGNTWGTCKNGMGATGCGPQETFRSCSDIKII